MALHSIWVLGAVLAALLGPALAIHDTTSPGMEEASPGGREEDQREEPGCATSATSEEEEGGGRGVLLEQGTSASFLEGQGASADSLGRHAAWIAAEGGGAQARARAWTRRALLNASAASRGRARGAGPGRYPQRIATYYPRFTKLDYLGAGTFGEVYRVKDSKDGKVKALKLLYVELGDDDEPHFLSWRLIVKYQLKGAVSDLLQAEAECEVSKDIRENSPAVEDREHVMQCHEHNLHIFQDASSHLWSWDYSKGVPDDAPLFLLLEDCGKNDLGSFIESNEQMDEAAILRLQKHLLRGINAFASMDPPRMHHDLKPLNVAVKGQVNNPDSLKLYLIDFGASVEDTPENECEWTACTYQYCPREFEWKDERCPGEKYTNSRGMRGLLRTSGHNFISGSGAKFDVFAAGCIFLTMVVDLPWRRDPLRTERWADISAFWAPMGATKDKEERIYDYDEIDEWAQRQTERLGTTLTPAVAGWSDSGKSFVRAMMRTLLRNHKDRPTAAELLQHRALTSI